MPTKRKEAAWVAMAKETKTADAEPTVGKRVQKREQVYNKQTKRWVFTDRKEGMRILLARAEKREKERDEKEKRERSQRAVKRAKRSVEPKLSAPAPAPSLLPEDPIVHTGASFDFADLSLS